jgi:glucose/arabinose dehydrogenase
MANCMRRLALLVVLGAGFASAAQPATAQQLVPFGGPYDTPRYIAGEPGDPSRVYVVEGAGRIRLVIDGVTQPGAFLDINGDVCFSSPEPCGSESGVFSMAFAPNYASSGLFYVFYTRDAAIQHDLVIREFRRTTNPNDIDEVTTGRDVLVIPHPTAANHNGGQLQFGPDGYLYISTGDGGGANDPSGNAQDVDSLLGKLLRIDPQDPPGAAEYSVPTDNPFAGATAGADEIYAYGLRNPYRFSFDRLTGDLTIGDVGQNAWEEIDFVANGLGGGVNFGWDCFEGKVEAASADEPQCSPLPSQTAPVHVYPNPGDAAVNGGYVVRDTTLPSLLGRYLYADTFNALGNHQIFSLVLPVGSSSNASTGLTANFVVSFGEDACGHVYVAHGNAVSRIQQTSGTPACQPQTVLQPPNQMTTGDATGPSLSVDARKGRRAAARGDVTLTVGCDEACTVHGAGTIPLPGKDIGLDPDDATLSAGVLGALHLDLSGKEARRLRRELGDGGKAKARVELTAADAAGNQSAAERRIKQKR